MRIHKAIICGAFTLAIFSASGANAFETTSVGGTNPDGTAKYQDIDDMQTSSMLGGTQVQPGVSTGFSQTPQQQPGAFSWSVEKSPGSSFTQPASGFNDPTLRDRN
jgi:hypothetical protein